MTRRKINGSKVTSITPIKCEHHGFHVDAVVHRVTATKDGPVVGRCLCLQVVCNLCGQQFAFDGLPTEKTHLKPNMTSTGLEARLPIVPSMGERKGEPVGDPNDTVRFTVQKDE